jgi:hypothetical protein
MVTGARPPDGYLFWIAAAIAVLLTLTGMSLYVDQLLITFLHESSHGLAAILTGGQLVRFTVSPDGSGLAHTLGGFRPLVLVAGYAGGCAWGGAMLVAARARGLARPVLFALCAFMAIFTLLFVRNLFGFVVGFGWAAFFGWAAYHGRGAQLPLLLSFLAVRNCINALEDLRDLILLSGHSMVVTDAQLMSQELSFGMIPPIVFAFGIALLSFAVFAAFAYVAFRPRALSPGEPVRSGRV